MIERAANPGDILDEELTITNESNSDKEFYIYKKNK